MSNFQQVSLNFGRNVFKDLIDTKIGLEILQMQKQQQFSAELCSIISIEHTYFEPLSSGRPRVSVQGVVSLWGDCRFIPADWGS